MTQARAKRQDAGNGERADERRSAMAGKITGLVGAAAMIGYVFTIAGNLAAPPLWICALVGVALALCDVWSDDRRPAGRRAKK